MTKRDLSYKNVRFTCERGPKRGGAGSKENILRNSHGRERGGTNDRDRTDRKIKVVLHNCGVKAPVPVRGSNQPCRQEMGTGKKYEKHWGFLGG